MLCCLPLQIPGLALLVSCNASFVLPGKAVWIGCNYRRNYRCCKSTCNEGYATSFAESIIVFYAYDTLVHVLTHILYLQWFDVLDFKNIIGLLRYSQKVKTSVIMFRSFSTCFSRTTATSSYVFDHSRVLLASWINLFRVQNRTFRIQNLNAIIARSCKRIDLCVSQTSASRVYLQPFTYCHRKNSTSETFWCILTEIADDSEQCFGLELVQ